METYTTVIRVADPYAPASEAGLGLTTRVTVDLPGGQGSLSRMTDVRGELSVSLPGGVCSVVAERPGYMSVRFTVNIPVSGSVLLIPLRRVGTPPSIGFRIQYQETSQWCWIAVATSINHFYNPASTLTQCSLMTTIGQAINGFPATTSACPSAATLRAHPRFAGIHLKPLPPERALRAR